MLYIINTVITLCCDRIVSHKITATTNANILGQMLFCCSLSRSSVVQPKDTATSVEKIHVSGFKALYRRICTRHTHYPSIHDDVCATELATSCVWADGGMKTLPAWRRLVQTSIPHYCFDASRQQSSQRTEEKQDVPMVFSIYQYWNNIIEAHYSETVSLLTRERDTSC